MARWRWTNTASFLPPSGPSKVGSMRAAGGGMGETLCLGWPSQGKHRGFHLPSASRFTKVPPE